MAFCPCCALSPNLFLPPGEKDSIDELMIENEDDEVSLLEAPTKVSSLLNGSSLADSHNHSHLKLQSAEQVSPYSGYDNGSFSLLSITCAIEEKDWEQCLEYGAQHPHVVTALGLHPWYIHQSREGWIERLEDILKIHNVLIGEIGLCRVAKWVRQHEPGKAEAMKWQRKVFTSQLQLAISYQRCVSVHCVRQQTILLDVFQTYITQTEHPPGIALHSFSGTAHHVQQLLQWEKSLKLTNNKKLLYFGFSHAVNYAMSSSEKSRRQTADAIRAVPADRLLAESDVNQGMERGGTAAAVAWVASCRAISLTATAQLTRQNCLDFLDAHREHARTDPT